MRLEASNEVLVAGDWHGDYRAAGYAVLAAEDRGIDLIVHLGDFGFHWPGDAGQYETYINDLLVERGIQMLVVDGNHDNHVYLASLPEHNEGPFGMARSSLWHIRRGARFEINDRTFGALGGAFSIDYRMRKLNLNWWSEEEPTMAQASPLIDGGHVDVLLTHDAPANARPPGMFKIPEYLERRSAQTQRLVQTVVDATTPDLHLHGHWHQFNDIYLGDTETHVVGLADSNAYCNLGVLDLDTLDVTIIDPKHTDQTTDENRDD